MGFDVLTTNTSPLDPVYNATIFLVQESQRQLSSVKSKKKFVFCESYYDIGPVKRHG